MVYKNVHFIPGSFDVRGGRLLKFKDDRAGLPTEITDQSKKSEEILCDDLDTENTTAHQNIKLRSCRTELESCEIRKLESQFDRLSLYDANIEDSNLDSRIATLKGNACIETEGDFYTPESENTERIKKHENCTEKFKTSYNGLSAAEINNSNKVLNNKATFNENITLKNKRSKETFPSIYNTTSQIKSNLLQTHFKSPENSKGSNHTQDDYMTMEKGGEMKPIPDINGKADPKARTPPRIALMTSGGGFRAMIAYSGVYKVILVKIKFSHI